MFLFQSVYKSFSVPEHGSCSIGANMYAFLQFSNLLALSALLLLLVVFLIEAACVSVCSRLKWWVFCLEMVFKFAWNRGIVWLPRAPGVAEWAQLVRQCMTIQRQDNVNCIVMSLLFLLLSSTIKARAIWVGNLSRTQARLMLFVFDYLVIAFPCSFFSLAARLCTFVFLLHLHLAGGKGSTIKWIWWMRM